MSHLWHLTSLIRAVFFLSCDKPLKQQNLVWSTVEFLKGEECTIDQFARPRINRLKVILKGFDCEVAIVNLNRGVYSNDSLGMVVDER